MLTRRVFPSYCSVGHMWKFTFGGSLPSLHKPATGLYLEKGQSSSQHHNSLTFKSILILSSQIHRHGVSIRRSCRQWESWSSDLLERYPHRVTPSHTLFAKVIQRIRDRDTFTVNRADCQLCSKETLHSQLWRRRTASYERLARWRKSKSYEQSSFSKISVTSPTSQLILQAFRHFTYVTAHSTTLPSLYLRHNSFSNPSVASPTSQLILQPF